ncbi:MAG: biotin--[acetyl-CoA-carboxylase] ligase [Candidatus Thorarchaeota archaeon]|jgi:BirA family biotin operon repressor/biotin-[acetyl-CoA-carboxylase] ligase
MVDSKTLDRLFEDLSLKPTIVVKEKVDSTNSLARELLEDGAEHGTIVVATEQTRGRGRHGRPWISPPGGLYASLILKPNLTPDTLPSLSLLVGCAIATAIKNVSGICATLKWPNDVLVEDLKVAGILIEIVDIEQTHLGVIIGFGINQNTLTSDFPDEERNSLTTIRAETGHETSLEELLSFIVVGIMKRLRLVQVNDSFDEAFNEWRSLTSTLGKRVIVEDGNRTIEGVARNIDQNGSLIIETASGILETVSVGDVIHARLASR